MNSSHLRLVLVAAAVGAIAACDSHLTTAARASQSSGGSGGGGGGGTPPTIVIDSPLAGALINVGDSVFVRVRVRDDKALGSLEIGALRVTGDKDLGTYLETPRYGAISMTFRQGLRDTTIRRYIKPLSVADTALDSLIVYAAATDSAGAADSARVRVDLVSGPKVTIVVPTAGDSIPAGVGVSVTARAQHPDGVARVDIRVRGEASWPTPLDTTITQLITGAPREVNFTTTARIPANAPLRSRVTITATAVDVNRQPGASSPRLVFVRSAPVVIPHVTQTVTAKSEITDSIQIKAIGEGIAAVGLVVRDSAGNLIRRDSVLLPPPLTGNVQRGMVLNLPISQQGKSLSITAFAVDQAGRTGYAVRTTTTPATSSLANALADSTLVVYGRTFTLPRQGASGDLAVDAARGNVFLSNIEFNRLEVWQKSSEAFNANGVAVGSLPWGLVVSRNPDTLLVANSGGTNISRVFIGSANVASMREDLANRILTRNTYAFVVTEALDDNTGKLTLSVRGPFSYSDRPQYIAQSATGRIFYSTRPTSSASAGTIRWLDPSLPVPDPRHIWQYGKVVAGSTVNTYVLLNVDSVRLRVAPATQPTVSDLLTVWDHPYGQAAGVRVATDSVVLGTIDSLNANGSDAEAVLRLDIASLDLTDTTFVAASGDRKWVAFGEGTTGGAPGRVVMVADSGGPCTAFISPAGCPNFYSPVVTVSDLTDNAAEQVFGLALDFSGRTVAARGLQSYFSTVADPFHLRLQGKYAAVGTGGGVAFHPNANGQATADNARIAFVGATAGIIDIVDIAYYISRGRLQLKNPIYGPIRASVPMPGDPPEVILKLFALTKQGNTFGLVVIDLTAADIRGGP